MISAGQTQNVQTTVTQSPPPSLGAITPLVCSNSLAEDNLAQCTDRLTDVYTANWSRTPENLRSVFEGFAELVVNSFFNTCSTLQSTPQTIGRCMFDAFKDGDILINLWGSDFTLAKLLISVADTLSGQPLPVCTFSEIQAGDWGFTCNLPDQEPCTHAPTSAELGVLTAMQNVEEKDAYMHERHICHEETGVVHNPMGVDPCHIANSLQLAAMMAMQSSGEKNTYMNEHDICHKEPQQGVTNPWE